MEGDKDVIGIGRGGLERGLVKNVDFLEILGNFENFETLEIPKNVENKGDSDHFLEILGN